MSKKCRAYSESRLGLEPSDNRKAFYAGWDAALREALSSPQPAQQDMPKIGCVNHDCDKCKAQQQEPFALLVRKHSWNKGQYECAPPNAPEYGRQWADERVLVYTSPQPSKPWVGLTTADLDEIDAPIRERGSATISEIYRAIEAKLKERNA